VRKLRRARALLRAELRAARPLIPLMALSLLTVFALSKVGVTLASPSFDSPVATPTTEAPALAPTEIPAAPPMESPPVEPISPTITLEIETPTIEAEVVPAEGAPPEEPPSPPGSPGATLVDALMVGFSYLWLCCGAMVLVLFALGVLASFLLRIR